MENKTGKDVWNDEIDWTKPFKCPVCGKVINLKLKHFSFHGSDIVANNTCPNCYSSWHSFYKFDHLCIAFDGTYDPDKED